MIQTLLARERARVPDHAHPVDRLSWRAHVNELVEALPSLPTTSPAAPGPLAQWWLRLTGTLFPAPAAWRAWLRDTEARELWAERLSRAYPTWLISRALEELRQPNTDERSHAYTWCLNMAMQERRLLRSLQSDTDVVALVLLLQVLRHTRDRDGVVQALEHLHRHERLWRQAMTPRDGVSPSPEAA
jgi:hypothetical protein